MQREQARDLINGMRALTLCLAFYHTLIVDRTWLIPRILGWASLKPIAFGSCVSSLSSLLSHCTACVELSPRGLYLGFCSTLAHQTPPVALANPHLLPALLAVVKSLLFFSSGEW